MLSATTVDATRGNISAEVDESKFYTPAVLKIKGEFGIVEVMATPEQLLEIEDALRMHREAKGGAA